MLNDIEERINRYHEFYKIREPALLVQIRCMDKAPAASKVHYLQRLWDFDFHSAKDRKKWFEELCDEVTDENMLHPLSDDYIPAGKIVWGPIISIIIKDRPLRIQNNSTWVEHFITDYAQLDDLDFQLDDNNFWWQLYKEGKEYLAKNLGQFVTPVYHQGILDLAYDLRGNELYTDLYDEPENAVRLIEFCTDAVLKIGEAQRAIKARKQTVEYWTAGWGFNVLVPGYGGITTCDSSYLISPEMFKKFEIPYIEKMLERAPGYLMHTHSAAKHQQELYASIDKIEILQVVNDPKIPDPVETFEELYGKVGLKPVLLNTTAESVYANIEKLKKGRVVLRVNVENTAEGEKLLSFVRNNSRISG